MRILARMPGPAGERTEIGEERKVDLILSDGREIAVRDVGDSIIITIDGAMTIAPRATNQVIIGFAE